jgi:hypothetical protein
MYMLSVILVFVPIIWRVTYSLTYLVATSCIEFFSALASRMVTQLRNIDTMALLYIKRDIKTSKQLELDMLKDLVIRGAQLRHHGDRDKIEHLVISSSDGCCHIGYVHKRGGEFVKEFAQDLDKFSVVSRSKELTAGYLPSSSYVSVEMKRPVSWVGNQVSLWRARRMLRRANEGKSPASDLVWHDPKTNMMTVAARCDGNKISLV